MWLEKERIKFLDKENRTNFFKELRHKSQLNYTQLASNSGIPVGRLRLYANGSRSLPRNLFDIWTAKYKINKQNYKYEFHSANSLMTQAGKLGHIKLKQKYGKQWFVEIGKQRMKNMRSEFEENPQLLNKWKLSVKTALIKKYGKGCYKKMGVIGGKRSIELADKEELKERYKKMFRSSFKNKILFNGQNFRSKKEVQVAKILFTRNVKFEYEKQLFGFYPDFVLDKNIIIEVVGFEWKPHIERTISKIKLFVDNGFVVVLYTYPNMAKYFENLPVKITKTRKELIETLGYNRGKLDSSGSETRK